jgi:hypothetical protein
MVRVLIGSEPKDIGDVTAKWINEQIERRGADGQSTCVRIEIKTDDVTLSAGSERVVDRRPGTRSWSVGSSRSGVSITSTMKRSPVGTSWRF